MHHSPCAWLFSLTRPPGGPHAGCAHANGARGLHSPDAPLPPGLPQAAALLAVVAAGAYDLLQSQRLAVERRGLAAEHRRLVRQLAAGGSGASSSAAGLPGAAAGAEHEDDG